MVTTTTQTLNNKGFVLLDQIFKENGWYLIQNEPNHICYTKFGHETDLFDIQIDAYGIHVSIPLKNSPYQYNTNFNEYFLACEYIETRFNDFIH